MSPFGRPQPVGWSDTPCARAFLGLLIASSALRICPTAQAGDFLEAKIQLEMHWRSVRIDKTNESHRVIAVRCVFGTAGDWLIEGDFPLNAHVTYWRIQ